MKLGKVLLLIGSVGAFIFIAACAGGNYWITAKGSIDAGQGLWKYCGYGGCKSYDPDLSWFKAVRAFAILACLAAAAGALMSLLGLVSEKVKGVFASIFLFGAAGCIVVALAIFTNKMNVGYGTKYGWSYILGWIGALGALGAAVIGIVAERF